jgi:hypothetical protein
MTSMSYAGFFLYQNDFKGIMTVNNEKMTNLIRNYDAMTEEGKNKLLLIGKKYLNKKDRIKNKVLEDKKKKFGNKS